MVSSGVHHYLESGARRRRGVCVWGGDGGGGIKQREFGVNSILYPYKLLIMADCSNNINDINNIFDYIPEAI